MADKSESQKNGKAKISKNVKPDVHLLLACMKEMIPHLTNSATLLTDAQQAIENESRLRQKIQDLESELSQSQKSNREQTVAFTTSCTALTNEFSRRSQQTEQKHHKLLQDEIVRHNNELMKSKAQLAKEQSRARSIETKATTSEQQLRQEMKDADKLWEMKMRKVSEEIEPLVAQNQKLELRLNDMTHDLDDQQTLVRGHEIEKSRLAKRVADLEAFASISIESQQQDLEQIYRQTKAFSAFCIQKAQLLPDWNRVPEVLLGDGIPSMVSFSTDEGYNLFAALIQSSVMNVMIEEVFIPHPLCGCREMRTLANTLFEKRPTREAVWRLIGSTMFREEPYLSEPFRSNLSEKATQLIKSWNLPQTREVTAELQQQLSTLFMAALDTWLMLMTTRDRLHVTSCGPPAFFNHDSADVGVSTNKVPGEFLSANAEGPLLCLFPAFYTGMYHRADILMKGHGIYQNSALLMHAIQQEQNLTASPSIQHAQAERSTEKR